MRIKETIYVKGQPVGALLLDSLTRQASFQSAEMPSLLPDRTWGSIDELKATVAAAYSKYSKSINDESPPL